jgi:hypothetical protein
VGEFHSSSVPWRSKRSVPGLHLEPGPHEGDVGVALVHPLRGLTVRRQGDGRHHGVDGRGGQDVAGEDERQGEPRADELPPVGVEPGVFHRARLGIGELPEPGERAVPGGTLIDELTPDDSAEGAHRVLDVAVGAPLQQTERVPDRRRYQVKAARRE